MRIWNWDGNSDSELQWLKKTSADRQHENIVLRIWFSNTLCGYSHLLLLLYNEHKHVEIKYYAEEFFLLVEEYFFGSWSQDVSEAKEIFDVRSRWYGFSWDSFVPGFILFASCLGRLTILTRFLEVYVKSERVWTTSEDGNCLITQVFAALLGEDTKFWEVCPDRIKDNSHAFKFYTTLRKCRNSSDSGVGNEFNQYLMWWVSNCRDARNIEKLFCWEVSALLANSNCGFAHCRVDPSFTNYIIRL